MSKAKLLLATLLATTTLACGDAPVTAPAGSSLTLIANPPFIVANGGVSVVTAIVVEPAGTFVPDGTEVFFFTDLGTIESSRQTRDGVARVNLVSDSRSGNANVTAVSGGAAASGGGEGSSGSGSASVTVAIGSARPETVVVTANPSAIRSNGISQITVNVFDGENGNPVANVPVILSLSAQSVGSDPTDVGVAEYLDSGGSQLFTDSNGQVLDTLRTRRSLGSSVRVTVTATTANAKTGTVTVAVN